MTRILFLLLLFSSFSLSSSAQPFENMNTSIPGVGDSSLDWADYDGDGDLDLLIAGKTTTGVITRLYRNDGGTFNEVANTPFIGIYLGEVAWGDFDNDNDPDLIITGLMGNNIPTTQMYRNDNGTFVDINAGITAMQASMVDWGDFDEDGDLDFFIAGANAAGISVTKVYRNNGNGSFTDIGANLKGLRRGDGQWFAYQGNTALMISGRDTQNERHNIVYAYENGTFNEVDYDVPNTDLGAFTVSENLSSQKVLVAGTSDNGLILRVYKDPNDPNPEVIDSWDGVEFASADWATNVSNFKQFVVMGRNSSAQTVTRVFKGADHYTFEEIDTDIIGLYKGAVKWGDFDGDGDDDLAIAGYDINDNPWTQLYKNSETSDNTVPTSPLNAWVEKSANALALKWSNGIDKETDFLDLNYEVRVGTSPGAQDVIAPPNNDINEENWIRELDISHLSDGTYYWAVRTVDESNARSPYTTEQVFEIGDDNFTAISAPFEAIAQKGTWADVDNDSDLDVILTGHPADGQGFARVYTNNGNSFSPGQANLVGIHRGSSELSDIDNDGDLDMLIHGELNRSDDGVTQMYRNDNGTFVAFDTGFGQLKRYENSGSFESVRFADIDNDGDEDLVFSGTVGIKVIQNLGGYFSDVVEDRDGDYLDGTLVVGDYDNDQDVDLILSGYETHAYKNPTTWLYENTEGTFKIGPDLIGLTGTPAWGDFDNDGDLDFVNSGLNTSASAPGPYYQDLTTFYRNDGDAFSLQQTLYTNYAGASRSTWGDYDNDGDLDLLITGASASPLYENRNGTFVNIVNAFDGFEVKFANWGDYDNDGDLDVLLTGLDYAGNEITKLYRNTIGPKNDAPSAPTHLTASVNDHDVSFSWNAGSDEETAAPGLSYNLRVGSTPGSGDIMSAPADAAGNLLQPALGNAYQSKSWQLNGLEDGTYYWSVQAVDGGFKASKFSIEQDFTVGNTPPPPPGDVAFTNSSIDLIDLQEGAVAWGDYDNDRDLDLLVTGNTSSGRVTKIYRNSSNTLVDSDIDLPGLDLSAVTWGDYDNDGDLDFAMNGRDAGSKFKTYLFRNTGSGFEAVDAGLPGLIAGAIDFGDYDNDGDLDLLLTGRLPNLNNYAAVFENDNGTFSDIYAGLPGIRRGESKWIDFDVDGDLDIMLTGRINDNIDRRTYLYKNNGGHFSQVHTTLPDVDLSAFDWGDFDSDGDPDLLITGTTGGTRIAQIYENNLTSFSKVEANLEAADFSTARWADFDNNGTLDVVIGGQNSNGRFTRLYQNDAGNFVAISGEFAGVSKGASAWGDYDKDGDLDLVVLGEVNNTTRNSALYDNGSGLKNAKPATVDGLSSTISGGEVNLSWYAATDEQTPTDALTYALRVGTTPGGSEILSAPAYADGQRKVVARGNAGQNLSWVLNDLPNGTYYWSVQAVDQSYAGSAFATEASFTVTDSQSEQHVADAAATLSSYPNPFNPTTEIRYALEAPTQVELRIYDLTGKEVATLVSGFQDAGNQRVLFDASRLASGVYMAMLKTETSFMSKKLVLLK